MVDQNPSGVAPPIQQDPGVKMLKYSKDSKDPLCNAMSESTVICVGCAGMCAKSFPNVAYDDIIEEKSKDDEMADDLINGAKMTDQEMEALPHNRVRGRAASSGPPRRLSTVHARES